MSPAPLLLLAFAAAPAQDGERTTISEALAAGQNLVVEQVLFVLNEEMITSSMVEEQMNRLKRTRTDLQGPNLFWQALADLSFELIALEGYRRLGLDEKSLDTEVTTILDQRIQEAGSRARFEDALRAEGYTLASFREFLKGALVTLSWQRVVTGEQPSPLEGYRARTEPTPAEVLAEFHRDPERWEQGNEVVWKVLQFHDRGGVLGVNRAKAVADALAAGSSTLAEAEASAQSAQTLRGDPAERNLSPDLRDFLLSAPAGQVSTVQPIPGIGGLILVVVERSPARTIGFEEAQIRITAELRRRNSEAALTAAREAIYRSSYSWHPDLPEIQLREFYAMLFRGAAGAAETEF